MNRCLLHISAVLFLLFPVKGLPAETPVDSFLLSPKLQFLVQLSSRREEIRLEYVSAHFHLQGGVLAEFRDGFYRYYTGPFSSFGRADAFRDSLGVADAFVTAFIRGQQVTNTGRALPGVERGRWLHPPDIQTDTGEGRVLKAGTEKNRGGGVSVTAGDTLVPAGEDSLYEGGSISRRGWLRRFIADRGYGRSTVFVLILYGVIFYSILTMMILLVVILINRNKNERKARLEEDLREKYQRVLMNYLFDEELPEKIPARLQKIASSNFKRKILIDQMIDLSINLRGDAASRLRDLYIGAGLHHDSVRKARSRQWHVKVKGIRELAFMDIREANDEIISCLDSRNGILRMEAQLALVKLGDGNPYSFLDYLTMPFSVWEQMTVHEMLIHHELEPPAFSRWLRSDNISVVNFSVKMIGIFKQEDAYPCLVELLDHPDHLVRKNVIHVLGEVKYHEAILPLKRMYRNEPYENCLEIVRAMGKMPDRLVLKFLQLVIDMEDDVQLQIEAAKAIHGMGTVGEETLGKMMKNDYKNYQIIIKHVLDKRIF